jgi:hypothetical protein
MALMYAHVTVWKSAPVIKSVHVILSVQAIKPVPVIRMSAYIRIGFLIDFLLSDDEKNKEKFSGKNDVYREW